MACLPVPMAFASPMASRNPASRRSHTTSAPPQVPEDVRRQAFPPPARRRRILLPLSGCGPTVLCDIAQEDWVLQILVGLLEALAHLETHLLVVPVVMVITLDKVVLEVLTLDKAAAAVVVDNFIAQLQTAELVVLEFV